MIKTQIQLPDALYRDLKRVAQEKEWSLAETLRRAAELLLERYPASPVPADEWILPAPRDLGWRGLTPEELHQAALDDMEPTLSQPDQ